MIRKAIIFHELMPKEQLIEEKLSESLSISRTPLRTALRRLIDEGLVETKGNPWTYRKTASEAFGDSEDRADRCPTSLMRRKCPGISE